jgi:hypothetical protein
MTEKLNVLKADKQEPFIKENENERKKDDQGTHVCYHKPCAM